MTQVIKNSVIQAVQLISKTIKADQRIANLSVTRFLYIDTMNELKEKVLHTFTEAQQKYGIDFLNQEIDVTLHKNIIVSFSTARDLTKELYQKITAEIDQELVQEIYNRNILKKYLNKPSIYNENYYAYAIKNTLEMPVTLENHIKKVLTPDGRDIVPPEIAEFVQKLLEIKREHNLSTQQLIEYSKEELLEFTDEKIINFDKLLSNREANLISIDGVTDEAINKIKAYTANFNTLITNKSLMGINKVTDEIINKLTTDIGKKQSLEELEQSQAECLAQFQPTKLTGEFREDYEDQATNNKLYCEII